MVDQRHPTAGAEVQLTYPGLHEIREEVRHAKIRRRPDVHEAGGHPEIEFRPCMVLPEASTRCGRYSAMAALGPKNSGTTRKE